MARSGANLRGAAALRSAFQELASDLEPSGGKAVGSPEEYGPYLERGTSQMPPYPWLQPSADETVSKGVRIAQQSDTIDQLIALAALDLQANAIRRLESEGARPYPRTGNLAGSVGIEDT